MTKRAVRLALLVVFLAAMGVTAYLFWKAERHATAMAAAAATFDGSARDAMAHVADLRAAQQAYVAAGQGADFWFARTSALTDDLKARIASLKSEASAPATLTALDDAFGVLQDFEQMDRRAREFTRGRQMVLASDLIFADGLEVTRKVSEAIDQARVAEASSRSAAESAERRRQMYSFGAALAAATLVVLLLLPSGAAKREAAEPVATVTPLAPPVPRDAADITLDLDESWAPAQTARPSSAAPAALEKETAPAVDLLKVAGICADLARLGDTRALPAVLERAAGILDASGIILWIADPDGRELAPIVTHGYPANLINRLGTIQRDAQNATAAALRTGLLQTVHADAVSNGAIAAPLVTAAGCVGVMAAEVRNGGEQHEPVVAAAGIVAAQLATLVGPPSSRAKAEAAG